MAEKKLLLRSFEGGISLVGEHKSTPFTARFIKNLDPFVDPAYLTLSKAATKVSGTTVTHLIYWAVDGSPFDTNKYFYSDGGKIYKETSGGTWSSLRTVTSSAGEGLAIFNDYLYYASDTDLGRYGKLTTTPAFDDNVTSWWGGAIGDIRDTGGGTGATDYVPPTSISEAATARQTWTASYDPIKEITINIDVVGTGNWTLTVHDSENNVIGSKTISNGSLSVGDNTFTFSSPLRVVIGNNYHFHITSTVADGGVDTDTDNDLE